MSAPTTWRCPRCPFALTIPAGMYAGQCAACGAALVEVKGAA